MWAAVAALAGVLGSGYAIYANEDAKRRQSNAIARAEAQQAEALKAQQTQEETFRALQNLSGYSQATDLSEIQRQEQTKRLLVWGGVIVAGGLALWLILKRKKRG